MLGIDPNGPVLILGPHPDDEIGCAGLIHRLIQDGYDVHHYFFSDCQESLSRINVPVNQLLSECEISRDALGIKKHRRFRFDFPVRFFPQYRQEILEKLIVLRAELRPKLVLVPNGFDIHQDHKTVYEEAVRAFKHSTILGYELPWNTLEMSHDCFVALNDENVNAKMRALQSYKSQENRSYVNIEFFDALLRMRGVQSSNKFAECFEVVRLML